MKKILVLFFIASFLLASLVASGEAGRIAAPDFSLKDIKGEAFRLSDFKDKERVLLLFWATWCSHCRRAMRELSEKEGDYKIITINVGESKKRVEDFLKKNDYKFRALLDEEGEVAFAYGILGIPAYILIDKDLKLSYKDYIFPSGLD